MVKIVVTQDLGLTLKDIEKLKKLGDLTIYDELSKTYGEWLERCKGADIICSGKFGLKQKLYNLNDVFISLPFVGIGWIDREKIKEKNIAVSYCPGCNKDAVSEWIIGMVISLLRDLPNMIGNTTLPKGEIPKETLGLTNKKITILGKGNIGSRVGKICKAFDMDVFYFKRGADLIESVKNSDIVVDCLSHNPTTRNILNKESFNSLKQGSFFITVTGKEIYDSGALVEALDKGIIEKAGIDAGGVQVGDVRDPYYKKLLNHPKIFVTSHIAYNTDVTDEVSNKMMIENIEAWIKGKLVNLVK